MSRQIIKKLNNSKQGAENSKAIVLHCAIWEEYQVEFYKGDVIQEGATYHTDDKDDAFDTAKQFVRNGN